MDPKPPLPINTVITATAFATTEERRRPENMGFMARGNLTQTRIAPKVIPMPRATSNRIGSMDDRPIIVFLITGRRVATTTTTSAGRNPMPRNGTMRTTIVKAGIACRRLVPMSIPDFSQGLLRARILPAIPSTADISHPPYARAICWPIAIRRGVMADPRICG